MTVSTKTLLIYENDAAIAFSAGDNLLDTLNANKISIAQSCGGNGTCTTCLVEVLNGLENCSEKNELELEHTLERNFKINERLACQLCLVGPALIQIKNKENI